MKTLLSTLLLLSPIMAYAAGGGHNEAIVDAPIVLDDKVSLQKGAQIFINNCLGCHSAKYMRYERVSQDLGIPVDVMKDAMLFADEKIGDPMISAMSASLAKKWFGGLPPDLTLVARVRGVDWLYSYLVNFYSDEARPWGVNNRVFPDVGMPHVLENMERELGPDDFTVAMADLTNFMAYIAEPMRAERERIGIYWYCWW